MTWGLQCPQLEAMSVGKWTMTKAHCMQKLYVKLLKRYCMNALVAGWRYKDGIASCPPANEARINLVGS